MRPANMASQQQSAQSKKKGATQNFKPRKKTHGTSKYTLESGSISNEVYNQNTFD